MNQVKTSEKKISAREVKSLKSGGQTAARCCRSCFSCRRCYSCYSCRCW